MLLYDIYGDETNIKLFSDIYLLMNDSGHKLYIIDYWVPFPSSEYGGVVIVTATSEEDAINVLNNHSWEYGDYYKTEMIEAVKNAKWYEIKGTHKSEIIEEFLT